MSLDRPKEWRRLESGRETSPSGRQARPALAVERFLLRQMLRYLEGLPLRFALWDGSSVSGDEVGCRFTVAIRDRATLWRLLLDPQLQFGRAYSAGRLEVEGDLAELIEGINRSTAVATQRSGRWRLPRRLPRRNSRRGSRQNIHHHYDLGNDFYRLWLDRELLYTCAYYPSSDTTLEEAQLAKMEHVCRKLRLEPGARVIEAGSGWGALALYMAGRYGVSVRSYNISRQQVEFARESLDRAVAQQRAGSRTGLGTVGRSPAQAGDGPYPYSLAGRVEFIEADYRSIEGECDAFVSVGMLEHVGRRCYRDLGAVMNRVLTDDGRALIHTIGRCWRRPLNPWIERHIFPGAYPPTLAEMMPLFEPHGLAVLDVENLRLHYAQTLRHWRERYETAVEEVRRRFDEPFVRAWRLYLCGSIAAFEAGNLQLFQVLVQRAESNRVAMTRDHLYERQEPEADGHPAAAREQRQWNTATR